MGNFSDLRIHGPKVGKTQIDTERQEIKEKGKELFKGYEISWFKLGFSNYIKSWLSSNYATKVREEFFENLKGELQELKDVGMLRSETKQIGSKTETRNEYFTQLFNDIMRIPDSDMTTHKKLELIVDIVGGNKSLYALADVAVGPDNRPQMKEIKAGKELLAKLQASALANYETKVQNQIKSTGMHGFGLNNLKDEIERLAVDSEDLSKRKKALLDKIDIYLFFKKQIREELPNTPEFKDLFYKSMVYFCSKKHETSLEGLKDTIDLIDESDMDKTKKSELFKDVSNKVKEGKIPLSPQFSKDFFDFIVKDTNKDLKNPESDAQKEEIKNGEGEVLETLIIPTRLWKDLGRMDLELIDEKGNKISIDKKSLAAFLKEEKAAGNAAQEEQWKKEQIRTLQKFFGYDENKAKDDPANKVANEKLYMMSLHCNQSFEAVYFKVNDREDFPQKYQQGVLTIMEKHSNLNRVFTISKDKENNYTLTSDESGSIGAIATPDRGLIYTEKTQSNINRRIGIILNNDNQWAEYQKGYYGCTIVEKKQQ